MSIDLICQLHTFFALENKNLFSNFRVNNSLHLFFDPSLASLMKLYCRKSYLR